MNAAAATTLYQVITPHFVAGVTVSAGVIVTTAPILNYTMGWTIEYLFGYCRRKSWKIAEA